MAAAAQARSMRLATLAHEETGYGIPADKNVKNLFSAVDVHNYFKNLRTVGVARDTGSVVEIATPRGVVAAIVPSTNPTSTAIFKILIATKSRNSIVLSPHPSATRCVVETANLMREAGVRAGLPAEAIGCVEQTTIEGTESLMKHKLTAVILATGGLGLVRAAYSSGKPAFGVTTLAAFAAPYIAADDTLSLAVAIDARHEHVYLQMFGPGGRTLVAPRIASLLPAHYEKFAELVDGHAERVERPEQIRPALERALASGKVAVVHVRVDPKAVRLSGGVYLR